MDCSTPGRQPSTISLNLLKLKSIESAMPPNHLILCIPLLLLPLIFSSFRVFSNESALNIRWPKYWSFNFSPSNKYLISFRMQFDLLALLGTLKSLLQHHNLKASIPWDSDTKEAACNAGDQPWVGMIPWRRIWQPSLVFLPGEFHGQRSLVGYSRLGHKELDMTNTHSHTTNTHTLL